MLDYAHIEGILPEEASLRSVTRGLPRQTRQVTHRAAMRDADVPTFLQKLVRQEPSVGRDALQLTILTAVRSNEARFATWQEFDLNVATWSIPAERMKMKQPHIVPLSAPASALLRRIHEEQEALGELRSDSMLFSANRRKPTSDTTMLKAIRDTKIETVTVHGSGVASPTGPRSVPRFRRRSRTRRLRTVCRMRSKPHTGALISSTSGGS